MPTSIHHPIVIVGGGPVGLTLSLLLSRLGVEHALVERHGSTSPVPRAILMNQRTIEVFRFLGLGEEVDAIAAPESTAQRSAWYTSFAGPTPLHGRRIAARDTGGGGRYRDEHAAASPVRLMMIPQFSLEPLLRRHAFAQPAATMLCPATVTTVDPGVDRVDCEVQYPDGTITALTADYLVVADGGRGLAGRLGITSTGPTEMVDMVSAHFTADLTPYLPDRGVVMNWFVNPDFGGSRGGGQLWAVGPWSAERHSEDWVFACAVPVADAGRFDEERMRNRLLRSLGVPDLDLTVHSVNHWQIQATVADRYRQGRVFLMGDSAHKVPPLGGLGMNTGIQDAENLAWKLAMALAEPALAALLDSYEAERRPVAQWVANTAVTSLGNHAGSIDAALGISPTTTPADNWTAVGQLWQDTDQGRTKRLAIAAALAALDTQFHPHGVEVGYSYYAGAISPQRPADLEASDIGTYSPTSVAGHHVPHAWLISPNGGISTIDLTRPGRLVLLVQDHADTWRSAVGAVDHPLARLTDIVAVGPGLALDTTGSSWERVRGITGAGALLIRPDKIVAWRSVDLPADPAAALAIAMAEIAGQSPRGDEVPITAMPSTLVSAAPVGAR